MGCPAANFDLVEFNGFLNSIQPEFPADGDPKIEIDDLKFSNFGGLPALDDHDLKRWILSTHKKHGVHEPGMAGTIVFLGRNFQNQKVDFYDIGALYGYFSLLAEACFPRSKIHAVEANPQSCDVIRQVVEQKALSQRIKVHQHLLGQGDETRSYYRYGFTYVPMPTSTNDGNDARAISMRIMADVRNGIGELLKVNCCDFLGFLTATSRPEARLILKIDAEGSQAVFLPGASQYLIDRQAILLLEFDSPEKLAPHQTTNYRLCKPFLDAGYRLFWLDHRKLHEPAIEILANGDHSKIERNSLGILLPQGF